MSPVVKTFYNIDDNPMLTEPLASEEGEFFAFQIVMNKDRKIYERTTYKALDWLSDVGGLFDGLC